MPLNPDFKDLLRCLNAKDARYLVVGAYAVVYYTEPRYTKDLDIWVEPTKDNAKKVYEALRQFGAPLDNLKIENLTNPEIVYQIGIEPNRVDILTDIKGLRFSEAWQRRRLNNYGDTKVYILDLQDLIRAKKKAGRPHDKKDLDLLSQVNKKYKRQKPKA